MKTAARAGAVARTDKVVRYMVGKEKNRRGTLAGREKCGVGVKAAVSVDIVTFL